MIARRLAQSLRDQNWTTITIEFVLLVLGVFLGIQAANWNAAQQDQQREGEYIERLRRDFAAIDERLAHNVSRWEQKASASPRLLADLDAFERDGRWPRAKADMLADLNNIFDYRVPAPRAATYIELVSAGQLGLIRDTALRDDLLAYDAQVGYSLTAYGILVQRVEPHMAVLIAHLRYDQDVEIQMTPTQTITWWADVDLASLAADNKLRAALNLYATATANQLFLARLQQEKARAVLAVLDPGRAAAEGAPP
jgi:hypothetical protein